MILTLDDIGCARGGRWLFEGVSLALGPGDAAVVTGPNGVGKSSLLRIAAGLLEPAAGSAAIEGRVTLLAEAVALDAERTVADALGFWTAVDGNDGNDGGAVAAALENVGLAHLAGVPVRMLSTGQRRRCAMARVIAADAVLWLLDEPANGLDDAAVERLEALIARHRAAGGAIMVATHQPLAIAGARMIALSAA